MTAASTTVTGRQWVPLGSEFPFADVGFLLDPEDFLGAAVVPGAGPLDALEPHCLVLLGEPGLGKTTELRGEYERRRLIGPTLMVNLGATREEQVLRQRIFDDATYKSWLEGDGVLHLFLDSLDEARLRIETVAYLLEEGLESAPVERLRLAIACRTANRHLGLESFLERRFGSERVGRFELAPLTRRQIVAAARERGVDPDHFLRQIVDQELQPLAMTPLTLRLLLDIQKAEGSLPRLRAEVLERGLRLLVREHDETRREAALTAGRLDPGARLAVAGRIAGALVLGGRSAASADESAVESADAVPLATLAGGEEIDPRAAVPRRIDVGEPELLEVLGTGLFSPRPAGRGLAHASYGEYLAARWLAASSLPEAQVRELLFISGPGRQRVIPQLREVASWLAVLDPDFADLLFETDAAVVLRAGPKAWADERLPDLVEVLLAGVTSFEIDRWDRVMRAAFAELSHEGIAEQLRATIFDDGAEAQARQVACEIAGACAVLEDDLTALALDGDAPVELRVAAVGALEGQAGDSNRRRLVPLATQPLECDVDDELKGAVLRAAFPRVLSVEELLRALTPVKRPSLYGGYKAFLHGRLGELIELEDLASALRWSGEVAQERGGRDPRDDVREQLLVRAWDHLDRPEVLSACADLLAVLLARHQNLLERHTRRSHPGVFADPGRCRALCRELVRRIGTVGLASYHITQAAPALVGPGDLDWALAQLHAAVGDPSERAWAEVVFQLALRGGDEDAVMEARSWSPELHELTAARYASVAINSEKARRDREFHQRHERMEAELEEQRAEVDLKGRCLEAIAELEAGDHAGFWRALFWLEFDPEQHVRTAFVSDVRALPGWPVLDQRERALLVAAAPQYLCLQPVEAERWFCKQGWKPALAAYRAFRMLRELAPAEFALLEPQVWARWAPAIVEWRSGGNEEGEREFAALMTARLFEHAPGAAVDCLIKRLDLELRQSGTSYTLERFGEAWSPELEAGILKRARRTRLEPKTRARLIEHCLRHRSADALALARRLYSDSAIKGAQRRRELAVQVAAAVALLTEGEWPRLWKLMQANEDFGRALVTELAANRERAIAVQLEEGELGALYEWCERVFPRSEDPDDPEAHFVSAREQIARWRDGVLMELRARGNPVAIAELDRLSAALPELTFLGRLRRQAEEIHEQEAWAPPRPDQVVTLVADARRRWVASAAELRRLVGEALSRTEARLRAGEARYLWSLREPRPEPENVLSDYIAGRLRDELGGREAIIDREVEVGVHPRARKGESVDLLVSAISHDRSRSGEVVSVAVEVKGTWHQDVDRAMEAQLAARYLGPKDREGVYVVGWFDAPDWTAGRRGPRRSLPETRAFFAEQAARVSGARVSVDAVVLDCSLRSVGAGAAGVRGGSRRAQGSGTPALAAG